MKTAGLFTLLIPILFAVLAQCGIWFQYSVLGITVSCVVIAVFFSETKIKKDVGFIVAAFVFSIIGGWTLANRHGLTSWFIYGIVLYFIAHLGYLSFCLRNGKINRWFLGIVLTGYLSFWFMSLGPAISDQLLCTSVFVYLLISCLSLAASFGLELPAVSRRLFFTGITFLVFSDTVIALHEFLDSHRYAFLIMPTYFISHILITAALVCTPYGAAGTNTDRTQ